MNGEPPIDPTGHLGGPEEHEAHRNKVETEAGAGDWYCPNCGYLSGSRVTFHETCDECHIPVTWITVDRMDVVKVLEVQIAELQAVVKRFNPEALEAEIQAVKDEHSATMKRLEEGSFGALDQLLTAAKRVVRGMTITREGPASAIVARWEPLCLADAAHPGNADLSAWDALDEAITAADALPDDENPSR